MTNKYIIGGGISGLVFQYYHPEYTIITPDIGGLFASAYIAIIHDTSETRHFLKDLGYQNVDKLAKKSYIGYYSEGWIQDNPTAEMKLLSIQRKMSKWNEPVNRDFVPSSFDFSTSTTVNYFKTMNVEPKEVVQALKDKMNPNTIMGKVVKITDTHISIEADGQVFDKPYDSLVSTVAAPIFWKLYGQPREFPFTPITNVITNKRPDLYHDRYDSVYYDDSVPFSRITHLQEKYAMEFTGVMSKDEFKVLYPDVEVVDHLLVQFGRISNVPNNEPPNAKITFLGRFAQWKYGIVLEHVVKSTLEYKEKNNV